MFDQDISSAVAAKIENEFRILEYLRHHFVDVIFLDRKGEQLAGYGFPSSRAIDKLVLLTNGDNAEIIIENFAKAWLQQTVTRIKRTASILSYVALATNAGYMVLILMATQNLNDLVGTH